MTLRFFRQVESFCRIMPTRLSSDAKPLKSNKMGFLKFARQVKLKGDEMKKARRQKK